MMSVGVEYPALPSTVERVGVVGFILRLKAQVFSLILYKVLVRPTCSRLLLLVTRQFPVEKQFDSPDVGGTLELVVFRDWSPAILFESLGQAARFIFTGTGAPTGIGGPNP